MDGVLQRVVHEAGVAQHAEREGAQAAVVVFQHPHERLGIAAPGGAHRLFVDLVLGWVVPHAAVPRPGVAPGSCD